MGYHKNLKDSRHERIHWRGQLAEENLDWIFVNMVPLLCDKTRIAKQQKIETWLNLYQLASELGLLENATRETNTSVKYVI